MLLDPSRAKYTNDPLGPNTVSIGSPI